MNSATPFPWPGSAEAEKRASEFHAIFENSPLAAVRCNELGVILEMNPAFRRTFHCGTGNGPGPLLQTVNSEDREQIDSWLRELFAAGREESRGETRGLKWTGWRQPDCPGQASSAVIILERAGSPPADVSQIQTDRWQAVGRLTGGVVHDFNNLLTGVMLYCDLLLTSLDTRDRRRRYAEEIRSAIVQASGLVRQLLVFARPQAAAVRLLCLNEVAKNMRDLMSRLIGEDITLDLLLDPELGAVKIDATQVQQVLLNLVLNARDAMPGGGRITVETSNCRFQPVAGTVTSTRPAFPCILLAVGDNGRGMDAETRRHLFEPFFTTKNEGKGTGIGLTTVHSIVTTNRGLIHFESEPDKGTRVMILFPRAFPSAYSAASDLQPANDTLPTTLLEIEKEKIL